jgi:hypothetical protein
MKKDIFNGKIATESKGIVKFTLIFTPLICILCGIIFLLGALFYDNVEYVARIFSYCVSSLAIIAGISYPLITLYLIKIYPKHRKITKHFIKEYHFREYDFSTEKNFYKD